jgi:hypothetical protein
MTFSSNPVAIQLLRDVGETLFGEHWVTPLAAMLGVRADTIRHINKGKTFFEVDSNLFNELLKKFRQLEDKIPAARANIVFYQNQKAAANAQKPNSRGSEVVPVMGKAKLPTRNADKRTVAHGSSRRMRSDQH